MTGSISSNVADLFYSKYTRSTLKGHSQGIRREFEGHSKDTWTQGTCALEALKHLKGSWMLRHLGTWTLRHLGPWVLKVYLGTRALKSLEALYLVDLVK